MAALLGALPMALGTGTGSELRRPLGISIVGGLIVSQVLTLYTTPVVYLFMDRLRLRFARRHCAGHEAGRSRSVRRALGSILMVVALSACAPVGPKYEPPKTRRAGGLQRAASGSRADAARAAERRGTAPAWWEVFGDARLNELEAKLHASNPTIAQAEARYRQARALVRQNHAQLYPTVGVGGSIDTGRASSRQGGSIGGVAPSTTTQYSVTGDAAWELDFWGRIRQTVNASVANAQASAGDREGTRLSLSAELALDYYLLRSLDAEQALLHQTIAAYQKSFTLTQNQYNAGIVARADVAQAETLLESARAQEVDTRLQRAQAEHAIAILTGDLPSSLTIDAAPLARRSAAGAGGTAVTAAGAPPGYRGCGTACRGGQRRDRRRDGRLLPDHFAERVGRLPDDQAAAIPVVAERLLVGGPGAGVDVVRRRRAAGGEGFQPSARTTRRWASTGRPCSARSPTSRTTWWPCAS